MRTRTDTIVFRLGFTLAVLVLGAFLALIGAIVLRRRVIVGGPAGWAAGIVLGLVVAQATRAPVRRAHRPPRRLGLASAAARRQLLLVLLGHVGDGLVLLLGHAGRVSVARALASSVGCAWPWKSGMTCWAMSS